MIVSELFQNSRTHPILKYVNDLISGKYKDGNLFVDLIEAMYIKNDKKEHGKGLQHMIYSPNLVKFAHILLTHSPKAYRHLPRTFCHCLPKEHCSKSLDPD